MAIASNGDFESKDSFDTAITMALLTERRANSSEVLAEQRRRGWIGDEITPGETQGSGIWLYEQSRNQQSDRNDLRVEVQNSLAWFVSKDYADEVVVDEPFETDEGAFVEAALRRDKSEISRRLIQLWKNTGV
jgi:phage gp46-like protein